MCGADEEFHLHGVPEQELVLDRHDEEWRPAWFKEGNEVSVLVRATGRFLKGVTEAKWPVKKENGKWGWVYWVRIKGSGPLGDESAGVGHGSLLLMSEGDLAVPGEEGRSF